MLENRRIEFNKSDFLMYLMIIPFMYPRGFSEFFSWYKMFFTLWTYGAAALIVLFAAYKLSNGFNRYKHYLLMLLVYFGYFALDTLLIQGSIAAGVQKLFITPVLCVFCFLCFEERIRQFVKCLSNVLVVLFVLNDFVFNPLIFSDYFSTEGNHIIFIGHVQIATQLGILGVFISLLLKEWKEIGLSRILLCLSIITMIFSDTAAGKIVIAIYILCFVIGKVPYIKNILSADSRYYVALGLGLNIILFAFMYILDGEYMRFGYDLSLTGRMFVWEEAFKFFKESAIFGYGAYGVLIKVFWSTDSGMNYAHNELVQRLLDGGIVLLIIFIILLFAFASRVRKVKNNNLKKYANISLLSINVVMLIESVTEYYYVYILWILIAHICELEKESEKYDSKGDTLLLVRR